MQNCYKLYLLKMCTLKGVYLRPVQYWIKQNIIYLL